MFDGKRVLVTGGAGLVGSHLAEKLLEVGANVRVTKFSSEIPYDHSNLEVYCGDLESKKFCKEITNDVDYVFHCAVNNSGTMQVSNNPVKYISSNLTMDIKMLESSICNRVKKFLFVSSAIVYPDSSEFMKEEDAIETDLYNRLWPASETKRCMERMCTFFHNNYDMDICIVRPSNIYGPRDNFNIKTAQVLPSLINKIYSTSENINISCKEDITRDFVYVRDFVNGTLMAMKDYCCGEPLNIGSGSPITLKFLVDKIIYILNKDIECIFDGNDRGGTRIRKLDIEKATNKVGFSPNYSIENGLRETIDWFLKYEC